MLSRICFVFLCVLAVQLHGAEERIITVKSANLLRLQWQIKKDSKFVTVLGAEEVYCGSYANKSYTGWLYDDAREIIMLSPGNAQYLFEKLSSGQPHVDEIQKYLSEKIQQEEDELRKREEASKIKAINLLTALQKQAAKETKIAGMCMFVALSYIARLIYFQQLSPS